MKDLNSREQASHADEREMLQLGLRKLLVAAGLVSDGVEAGERSGLGQPVIQRLRGGGNNAVFRSDVQGQSFLLKQYFMDPLDQRDRFGAEVTFLKFAWDHGIHRVPRLLASSREQGLTLLEFIDGSPVSRSAVTASLVEQAVDFCQQLFVARSDPAARSLPVAAEACFSIQSHLECIENRIRRLQAIRTESELHGEALQFVQEALSPSWHLIQERVQERCRCAGLHPDQTLTAADRCLSPSDFGFHNSLVDSDGRLRFFDFEYAGWDDPAKLVADFFCQVEVPVPQQFIAEFAEGIVSAYANPDTLLERIRLLFPVYQLKWCCIVLNDFLPTGRARREFSEVRFRADRQPEAQLQKARRMLDDVRSAW